MHLNHLAVVDIVADRLGKAPYDYEVLGGYFCPSSESWIQKKLSENYLRDAYRESYASSNKLSGNIDKAMRTLVCDDLEFTVVHICGIDAIKANGKKTSFHTMRTSGSRTNRLQW